jgi:membrane protein involved in colicin uptake
MTLSQEIQERSRRDAVVAENRQWIEDQRSKKLVAKLMAEKAIKRDAELKTAHSEANLAADDKNEADEIAQRIFDRSLLDDPSSRPMQSIFDPVKGEGVENKSPQGSTHRRFSPERSR